MLQSTHARYVLVLVAGLSLGLTGCLEENAANVKTMGGAGGGSGGGGGSRAGGSDGSGGSAVGGSAGGSAKGGNAGGSGGGSGGKTDGSGGTSSASGGAAGSSGGSGGGAGGSSGGAGGSGATAGSGGAAGAGGNRGTGGSQPDGGPDGRTDGRGADRTDSPADVVRPDTAIARDVVVTDAACSPACVSPQTCVSGQCMCSNGLAACGTDCTDLSASPSHCGSCYIACGSGETCNNGVCVEGGSAGSTDGCSDTLASGLTLKEIAVYQSVKIPVMQNGTAVAAASRNARVVQGRDTMVRVFVTLGSGWTARELAARLTLSTGNGEPLVYYSRKTISASSTEADMKTTFQIFVPPSAMVDSLRYSVEVVECGDASGTPGQARFPQTGDTELGTKKTGALKLTLIPIKAGNYMPDTSATEVNAFMDYMRAMYPADSILMTVGDSITTQTPVDFNTMLDQVRAKRSSDRPPNDVYYFGLVKPADTFRNYCKGSCVTGIGYVVTSTGSSSGSTRAALGVAFADQYSRETMAHEVGHNHGRSHSPCVSGGGTITGVDRNYPYSDGGIGVWGYDSRTQKLIDPAKTKDIMSYCSPLWLSDYTYDALATRVTALNGTAMIHTPAYALSRWRILLVGGPSGPRWGIPVNEEVPPEGDAEAATIFDSSGAAVTSVAVYRTDISDGMSSMYMVPEPQPGWYAVAVAGTPAMPFEP